MTSCRLATDQLKRLLRRRWSLPPRAAAAALLVLALSAALLSQRRQLRRHVQNAGAWLTYELDPGMMGRSEARDPSPRCCVDEGCAPPPGARVAVVTYIRDDAHAPLLQQLECTLRRASPGLELGLMVVEGELGDDVLALARRLNITLLPVEPLQYANSYEPRWEGGRPDRPSAVWGGKDWLGCRMGCKGTRLGAARSAEASLASCRSNACPKHGLPQVQPQLAQGPRAGADTVPLGPAAGC